MQRVTGIGGIFFKARDTERLREWYREHLGLPVADWGGVSFDGREARPGERQTSTVCSVFSGDTRYFEPSTSPFMINYRVDDLDGLLAALRAGGLRGGPADRGIGIRTLRMGHGSGGEPDRALGAAAGVSTAPWRPVRATCRASARALRAGTGSPGAVPHP